MTQPTEIILANLGAPAKPEEVRPFLKNLFNDPDIFHFPFGKTGQSFFSSLISTFRAPKSQKYYNAIGGGSPLHKNTLTQAEKLKRSLYSQGNYRIRVAQRYWNPFISEIAEEVRQDGGQKIILLPLFPHYSTTSTLSIVNEWKRVAADLPEPQIIERFYSEPLYIDACAEQINKTLKEFSNQPHILFSAHSIPVQRIVEGDPYEKEIVDNMELIMANLGLDVSYSLCYQSKVGPIKWLKPTVESEIDRLVAKGINHVLIFPISFVSEHLETLYELDIQKRDYALTHGIHEYRRASTVQDSDLFIQALAKVILEKTS
ncbi:MAG: ferrochelatase [Candidatus Marinimicrobia bacterium]|nr:ferrochelatase [Candidatus Neomarinimicrobiota bacterium]